MVSDSKKKREAAKKAKASAKLHGTEGSPSVSTSTVSFINAKLRLSNAQGQTQTCLITTALGSPRQQLKYTFASIANVTHLWMC